MRTLHRHARYTAPLLSKQRGCVAAWKAGLYGPSGTRLRDFISDTHHAQFGSTTGADSNDPLALGHGEAVPYLYLPGVASNYASVPDAADLRITGDLTLVFYLAPGDWTPGARAIPLSKWLTTGEQRGYSVSVETDGKIRLGWSTAGTAATNKTLTSSAAPSLTDGQGRWIRAALDVDNGAGGHTGTFEESPDGVTWSAIGTAQTGAGTTSIFASTSPVDIAIGDAPSGGSPWANVKFYRAQVYSGLPSGSPSKVLDIDFTNLSRYNATRTSLTAETGQTVTINRATSGRKSVVVDRPLLLFGTDDYLEVADHADLDFAVSDSFTLAIAVRQYATPLNFGRYISKQTVTATDAGYSISANGTNIAPSTFCGDGTLGETKTAGVFAAGAPSVIGMRRRAGVDINAFTNGVLTTAPNASTLTATLANSGALRIGRSGSGATAAYQDFEFLAAALFRRGLTDREIRQLNRELLGVPV